MIGIPRKILKVATGIGLVGAVVLGGCASTRSGDVSAQDRREESARQRCLGAAARRQRVQIPLTATTGRGADARTVVPGMSSIDVPMGIDEQRFAGCMQDAGYPSAAVDPEPYLAVARECLRQADAAGNFDRTYRDCVGRNGIRVDVDTDDPNPSSR